MSDGVLITLIICITIVFVSFLGSNSKDDK